MTVALVTGGTGFLGAHLARALVAGGHQVHTLSRRPAFGHERTPGTEHHVLDIADEQNLHDFLQWLRPEVIYHLATTSRMPPRSTPAEQARIGLDDVDNLLTLVAQASLFPPRLLVRAGSIAEYGCGADARDEEDRERPRDPYGVAALTGTHMLRVLSPSLPFAVSTARLALLYGSGQSRRFLLPNLVAACVAGEPVHVDRPDDVRDWLHVQDAVEGLIAIAEAAEPPHLVNLSTGIATSAGLAASIVGKATGAPVTMTFGEATSEPMSLVASPKRAERLLGWQARTELRSGIEDLVESAIRRHGGWSPFRNIKGWAVA